MNFLKIELEKYAAMITQYGLMFCLSCNHVIRTGCFGVFTPFSSVLEVTLSCKCRVGLLLYCHTGVTVRKKLLQVTVTNVIQLQLRCRITFSGFEFSHFKSNNVRK